MAAKITYDNFTKIHLKVYMQISYELEEDGFPASEEHNKYH